MRKNTEIKITGQPIYYKIMNFVVKINTE